MREIDTRGSMPFAILAVTILLVSVAAAGVAAGYQRAGDGTDGTNDDISSIDTAVSDVTTYVNRGLGEIIFSISTDDTLGDLESRVGTFERRAAEWISYQFPMVSGGARVTCESYDIGLVSEPMGLESENDMDGYIPTYLRGIGTVSVHIESQSGRADTDLEISSDGSYALPLATERGSLFESMTSGGGITLSQMMTYQLTALAQYRILNGYGGTSAYGDRSTDAILTTADVQNAYDICIQAISALCFRDGELSERCRADLADMLASEDGEVVVDISAVYSQALIAAVDDILLRWMDYFYGFEVLEAVEDILRPFRDAVESLLSFLSGEEKVSGVPYLKGIMEMNGLSESDYRFPGSGSSTVTIGGYTVTVQNPAADLFSMSWLTDFKQRYESDRDYIEDYVLDILRGAAVRVAERTDLGTVTIDVDPHDSTSFLDALMAIFQGSIAECSEAVEAAISDSLGGSEVHDEFYGKLADEISSHSEDFVLTGEYGSRLSSALSAAIDAAEAAAAERGGSFDRPDIGALMASDDALRAVELYRGAVYSDLSLFGSLREVSGGDGGIVKRVLTEICSYGLGALDIIYPVEEKAQLMVSEILGMNGVNPYGGVVDLPGSDRFELRDDVGNEMDEMLSATVRSEPIVSTVSIDRSRCMHTVGFRDDSSAAYSTMFIVTVKGWVDYSITGSGSLAQSMGGTSSAVRGGFTVDSTIEIPLATGWALAGISYEPTCTVLSDLWNLLLEALDPILEPLREVMSTIRGALTALGEALMEAAGFVSEHLIRLYNAVMEPIENLKRMLEETLEDAISEAVFGILVDIGLDDQNLTFQFFGCTLTLTTSAVSWVAKTKTLLTVTLTMPVAGLTVEAGITAKVRGEMVAENLIVTGFGGIEGDDWNVHASLDPLMRGGKYLVTVDGDVGDTSVSVVAPKLENYYEMGIALSDIPGVGEALSNIPLPLIGVNVGLDAGFSIRYSTAIDHGVLINEVESNPEGTDSDNEWVEIVNNTDRSVDLGGWTLSYSSGTREDVMPLTGTLQPGGLVAVSPSFTLNNTAERTLRILDDSGEVSDSIVMRDDSENDGSTWQRKFDGATQWVFSDGSVGLTNGNILTGSIVTADTMKDCVWTAVEKSFGKVESIKDVDTLVAFTQYLVRYTLEEVIDVVSGQLLDASVYAEMDIKDATSTATSGIRVALRTDGELVRDALRYVAGQLESILLGMKNPYRIDPLEMFTENIDLEVVFHAGIGFPELLSRGLQDLPRMDLGVVFRANLSSITGILGVDTGDPEYVLGLMARDCPEAVIPSKLGPKDGMEHDLWLMKATITVG